MNLLGVAPTVERVDGMFKKLSIPSEYFLQTDMRTAGIITRTERKLVIEFSKEKVDLITLTNAEQGEV